MVSKLAGYAGKILRVDMTREAVSEETVDEPTLRAYLGGAGLGSKVLSDEVPPGVQWADPENRLVLASGPLGGTSVGGTGTFSVSTKGALTNGATTTQANGFLGAYLRFCGYDAIVVQGEASRWLYLLIREGGAELKDAGHLMGRDTWETDTLIKQELGHRERAMSVFCIGPAGENLVKFAAICGDKGHVAGHNGVGAVMGSKKLKAIAVERGKRRIPVKEPRRLLDVSRQLLDYIKVNPGLDTYNWGTLQGVTNASAGGWLPVKNYTTNIYPIAKAELERYGAEYIRGQFQPKKNPCWACQLHHCHLMRITEGQYKGELVEEPEYEGFAAWGPATGQTDVANTMVISNDVDRLGFDTNECGWVIGMVMECYEKGILTLEDTDGLAMGWGNADATRAILRRIAHRQGIGDILAEGAMRAAARLGGEVPSMAVHTMKGNSPRGHDHRTLWHELFDTCVSNTGTIETSRAVDRSVFGLPQSANPFSTEDVVLLTAKTKGSMQFEDSLGICRFNSRTHMGLLVEAVRAATGWDFTFDEAMDVGLRTVNLLRVFNLRHGIGPEMDRPSPRYGSTPVDGPAQGVSIMPHWDSMVGDYYEMMGWDRQTSRPQPETLRRLGLESLIPTIWT
ncbi:MAG: hypothetical protein HY531_02135 [Chloroflexi bacterium]|nr:hypothetical protein [Chloroflexota bacterium]